MMSSKSGEFEISIGIVIEKLNLRWGVINLRWWLKHGQQVDVRSNHKRSESRADVIMIASWNLVFSILRAASESAYPTRQSQHTLRAAQMLVSSSDDKYGGRAS